MIENSQVKFSNRKVCAMTVVVALAVLFGVISAGAHPRTTTMRGLSDEAAAKTNRALANQEDGTMHPDEVVFNAGQKLCNCLGNLCEGIVAILTARTSDPKQMEAIYRVARFDLFRDFYDYVDGLARSWETGDRDVFKRDLGKVFSTLDGKSKTVLDALYVGDGLREAKEIAGRMVWTEHDAYLKLLDLAGKRGEAVQFRGNF